MILDDDFRLGINTLLIFNNLLEDTVIKNIISLSTVNTYEELLQKKSCYDEAARVLIRNGLNLTEYVYGLVLNDDNFYIRSISGGETVDERISRRADYELRLLQQLSQYNLDYIDRYFDERTKPFLDNINAINDQIDKYKSYEDEEYYHAHCYDEIESKIDSFREQIEKIESRELETYIRQQSAYLKWQTSEIDFVEGYHKRLENIHKYGFGKYAKNKMFILRSGETVPVKYPDPQKLSHLYGYEREREIVKKNTLALLEGKPAQNVLLYGDAGTGKSSTVKAVVNEYAERGLRLIEITKEQLRNLPELIDEISSDPLKFIIFIDDLSFSSGEDCFGALKAALEGSVSARADNIVIYATSNRRHLVKESFSEREGDDIHRNDTMQENLSLSARFGLRVNFGRPDKNSYIEIVKEFAKANNIDISDSELALKSEQFALKGSGRSPRTAKQFINQLINESK